MWTGVLFFLTFLPLTFSLPALGNRQTDLETTTDNLLFSVSIATFESRRTAKDPPELDWVSNGCSDSPDNPFGFNFKPSCQRHDFGYRNYKTQSRFTDANKSKIDKNFKKDMDNQCGKEVLKVACKALAVVYYEAVKEFGSISVRAVEDEVPQ